MNVEKYILLVYTLEISASAVVGVEAFEDLEIYFRRKNKLLVLSFFRLLLSSHVHLVTADFFLGSAAALEEEDGGAVACCCS